MTLLSSISKHYAFKSIDSQQEDQIDTVEACLQKGKNVFKELKINIIDTVVNRTHGVGKVIRVDDVKIQQMIVRFTSSAFTKYYLEI